jgi:dinuclear metal center YbgI/SA1388 family protein
VSKRLAPKRVKRVTAGELCAAADELAPLRFAAEWDNVGLLAGRPEWPVRSALLAIDLTDAVAEEALRKRADALVLYHPPILKGIRAITPAAEGPTTRLPDLLAARVSLLALHTALDAAAGGTNDILLDVFEPVARRPLELRVDEGRQYKLVVFVPPPEVSAMRNALAAAGAGVIGHYRECSFELAGRGTFRGDETTHPTVGRKLNLEHADEVRLEMVVPQPRLGDVVRALYASHSYEEPAFDLYPLHETPGRAAVGLGRVGELKRPARGDALIEMLGRRVDLSCAMVVGTLKRSFRSVTAAAGSFGVRAFRDGGSLVLTGEFKHHDALELQRHGVTAVYLGHYASERPALDVLKRKLAARLPAVRFELARSDRSPLAPLRLK